MQNTFVMNHTVKRTKNIPKGDRMNWEPIASVKPVRITNEMIVGKRLTDDDLQKNANHQTNYRIP